MEQHTTGAQHIHTGNFKKKMVTWENKNYVAPQESVYGEVQVKKANRFDDRESAANYCKSPGLTMYFKK